MAFENMERPFKKASEMKVGDSVEGYVTGFYSSALFPDIPNLEMETKDGKRFILSVTGTLKYFKDRNYPLGIMYKFTRREDSTKVTPGRKPQKQFEVQADRTDVHPTFKVTPAGAPPQPVGGPEKGADTNADRIPF